MSTTEKQHYAKLREDERAILRDLAGKQKEVEILLEQLKALNKLLAEAADRMQVDEFEERIHREREEREQVVESIEELVQDTRTELQDDKPYVSLSADQLEVASRGVERLYQLSEQKNPWSPDEAKEFFTIQNAVTTSLQYTLTPGLQDAVVKTYDALKTVQEARNEDISLNYKPADALKNDYKL